MSRALSSEAQLAEQVDQLLGGDPVCMGRVTRATTRAIAQLLLREPEPDHDVLAERQACLALLNEVHGRLIDLLPDDPESNAPIPRDAFALELRRIDEAWESMRLGLHRLGHRPAVEGADGTDVGCAVMPPAGCDQATVSSNESEDRS